MADQLNALSQRQQQYIEAIDELGCDGFEVRTKTLADRLGVKMPSVTEAIRRMATQGLVRRDRNHLIHLTACGRKAATRLHERHVILRRFMTDVLDMAPRIADEEACRIEHATRGAFVEKLEELTRALTGGQLAECQKALNQWKQQQRKKH
jgi:DtxR family Mn-dependent transcriptional regulator